eukprot:CAMPEP_0173370160 /NCGR_PEP_ID=MMETSP1144-20121109/26528_1 /TAXON_ID=483371 /ORGANISM="non described non described, Strain CCMP2298" /LENGTH=41 /DNA_ID= /DNA_START= /DNA_END= /DNA_ORIENTATION=
MSLLEMLLVTGQTLAALEADVGPASGSTSTAAFASASAYPA